jgi:hypothetical protein
MLACPNIGSHEFFEHTAGQATALENPTLACNHFAGLRKDRQVRNHVKGGDHDKDHTYGIGIDFWANGYVVQRLRRG